MLTFDLLRLIKSVWSLSFSSSFFPVSTSFLFEGSGHYLVAIVPPPGHSSWFQQQPFMAFYWLLFSFQGVITWPLSTLLYQRMPFNSYTVLKHAWSLFNLGILDAVPRHKPFWVIMRYVVVKREMTFITKLLLLLLKCAQNAMRLTERNIACALAWPSVLKAICKTSVPQHLLSMRYETKQHKRLSQQYTCSNCFLEKTMYVIIRLSLLSWEWVRGF